MTANEEKHNPPFQLRFPLHGISLVAALSLSGHIGGFRPSSEDRAHLEDLREKSRASLIGAGTLRKENPEMRGSGGRLDEKRIRAIVSLSGDIPFSGKKIFMEGPAPIIFTSKNRVSFLQKKAGAKAEIIGLDFYGDSLDLRQAVDFLEKKGAESILVEGGGGLNFHALQQGIVHELFLTLCPKIIGNPEAEAFLRTNRHFNGMKNLELADFAAGAFSEIFLRYRVIPAMEAS